MSSAPVRISTLGAMKQRGERIACLTCYDATFCQLLERAGIEVLLVGDSLGMVVQGHDTTLPVRIEQMVYHTACVTRVRERAFVVADLPFLSYATPERALASAASLMQEGGAHMVKLEGGASLVPTVRLLARHGVPVCAHLGLLPQSVLRLGGYRYQGRDESSAEQMLRDAVALQEAGAGMLVLECVPAALAREISLSLTIPVIGIAADNDCDGQVLVLYDMLGLNPHKPPGFSKDFLADRSGVADAVAAYVQAVKAGAFPAPEHTKL